MATTYAGEDEDNGKGSKREGNGMKRAIARKRAMVSVDDNKMMATETMTQHCCRRHHCPRLSSHGSSLCVGALVVADNEWWRRMRTIVGVHGGGSCVLSFSS